MMGKQELGGGRGFSLWMVLGWLFLVAVGGLLIWYGFFRQPAEEAQPATAQPTPVATSAPLPTAPPTETPTPAPTDVPTPMPAPTEALPTAVPAVAKVVVGPDGINVRNGPGTDYTRVGSLDAGAEALVNGQYGGWWQIEYQGSAGWVYGELVTASDVAAVPEVQPPAKPTAAPATAAPAATQAPAATVAPTTSAPPAGNARGLVVNNYVVEGAPGPYAVGAAMWFSIDITNSTAQEIRYSALGTWVQETGQYQKSYFAVPPNYPSFVANQRFTHRDRIIIPAAGAYHLWLAIQFDDGVSALLAGPVAVTVQ